VRTVSKRDVARCAWASLAHAATRCVARMRGLATLWEGFLRRISAVAVTRMMSWCGFREALSP
jgi:hypothetical protein